MKQVITSAAVAAIVCILAFAIAEVVGRDEPAMSLSYTVEPTEDSWVSGARQSGPDDRLLSDADNSVCFLTKVEVSGMRSPEDRGICRIAVDEFTGFWKVTAEVPEGSQSEMRCNARCLVWE